MQKKRQVWTVTATNPQSGIHDIIRLELTFRKLITRCAAENVAERIRHGASEESIDYQRKKAKAIRDETGETVYFSRSGINGAEFSIGWQRNTDPDRHWGWYGASIESAELTTETAKALVSLAKIGKEDLTPGKAIEALRAVGSRYCSPAGDFIPHDISEILSIPDRETKAA